MVYDYSDGTLAFKYSHRTLSYQVYDKLACVDQGAIVDNKRLGTVLKLAYQPRYRRDCIGELFQIELTVMCIHDGYSIKYTY